MTLEDIEMTHFYSKEKEDIFGRKDREGVIATQIDDQATTMGFVVNKHGKFLDGFKEKLVGTVLYLGPVKNVLPLSVQVIESDDDSRKALAKATAVLKGAGAFASKVPSYGTAVSAGMSLTTSLLDIIKASVDDDEELLLESALFDVPSLEQSMKKLGSGVYTIKRPSPKGKKGCICIKVRASRFAKALGKDKKRKAIVVLHSVEMPSDEDDKELKKNRVFSIHTSFGGGKNQTTFQLDVPGKNGDAKWTDIMTIRDRAVYYGPFDPLLPFQAKIYSRPKAMLKSVLGIVDAGATFAKEFTDAKVDAHIDEVTKALSSARDLVHECGVKKGDVPLQRRDSGGSQRFQSQAI